MILKKSISYLLLLFVFSAMIVSCYTPTEGCLDPESTNYGIEDDRDCDDCCVFPTIKLSLFHQYQDTTLFLGDTLTNDLGQNYSLIKFVYLLSDFKMKTEGGQVYEVLDSIQVNINTGTEYVKDDIVRVSRSTFSYNFGTVIFDGEGDQLSFLVGLPEILNKDNFTSEVSGHPLTSDPDSLYIEETDEYIFQRVQIAFGDELQDTMIYDVVGQSNVQEVTISFPMPYESIRGTDKTIIIEATYNDWFDDVDFTSMTKEEIEAKIAIESKSMFKARLQ